MQKIETYRPPVAEPLQLEVLDVPQPLTPPAHDPNVGALLEQATVATRLWSLLRDSEPGYRYLSGRELGNHLQELLFGGSPSKEQRELHSCVINTIHNIADNFDPLRYYANVMNSWPLSRFGEVFPKEFASELQNRPLISVTPLAVEVQLTKEDWIRAQSRLGIEQIGFLIVLNGPTLPNYLAKRLIGRPEDSYYKNRQETHLMTLHHERAHALDYLLRASFDPLTVGMFRYQLAELVNPYREQKVENLVRAAISTFESQSRGEIIAHYLSGDRAGNTNEYLRLLPRQFLEELHEFLWVADLAVSDKERIYSSAVNRFQNSKQAVQEFHWLADQLFFPRNGTSAPVDCAAGLLLLTPLANRHQLCSFLSIRPNEIAIRMGCDMRLELLCDGDQKTLAQNGINPHSAFPSAVAAFEYVFNREGRFTWGEIVDKSPALRRSLKLAPDRLSKETMLGLWEFSSFYANEGIDMQSCESGAAILEANKLKEDVRDSYLEHFPSFRKNPPIRKLVHELLQSGDPASIRAAVELIPARDFKNWGEVVFPKSALESLEGTADVDLICLLLDRVGNTGTLRKIFDIVERVDTAALTRESVSRMRASMRKAVDEIAPKDAELKKNMFVTSGFLGLRRTVLEPTARAVWRMNSMAKQLRASN